MCEDKLREYIESVYKFSLINLKNKSDAEDVCQEVMYKYLINKPKFDNDKAAISWFYKVTINLCHDIQKSTWYKNVFSLEKLHSEDHFYSDNTDNTIIETIKALPNKYSEVIFLYYYQGYSAAEIAEILNKRENTIYSRLNRGREMLKEKLKED